MVSTPPDFLNRAVLRQLYANLYGRYEFRKFSDSIDLDAIVQQLTQAPSH